ncbi:MAG: PmoA family protein [Pirellulales bacterium]|nr:PmoA family protein [Pirellulales bacterium]
MQQVPLRARLVVPSDWPVDGRATLHLKESTGESWPAQLGNDPLVATPKLPLEVPAEHRVVEVHFVAPELHAGKSCELELELRRDRAAGPADAFAWHDTPGKHTDLVWHTAAGARPVLRYMYEAIDESSPARREETYKIYHHVFAPDGTTLLTKGPGGRYTHHRGLFFGYNRVSYDGKQADVWHCKAGAHQSHEAFLASEAGPVFGRHQLAIDWHGAQRDVFARERRELTVYAAQGGCLIDFAALVETAAGPVRLDGDPQHAGFHFRAAQEVAAETFKQTYYLRPDGRGEPGATRNWPDQRDHVNLPWDAMSFVVGGQRYTALYLVRPENHAGAEARFSERDYGRFGSYFEHDLTGEQPLAIRYRVWIQPGELTVEQAGALSMAFLGPPAVEAVALP